MNRYGRIAENVARWLAAAPSADCKL